MKFPLTTLMCALASGGCTDHAARERLGIDDAGVLKTGIGATRHEAAGASNPQSINIYAPELMRVGRDAWTRSFASAGERLPGAPESLRNPAKTMLLCKPALRPVSTPAHQRRPLLRALTRGPYLPRDVTLPAVAQRGRGSANLRVECGQTKRDEPVRCVTLNRGVEIELAGVAL